MPDDVDRFSAFFDAVEDHLDALEFERLVAGELSPTERFDLSMARSKTTRARWILDEAPLSALNFLRVKKIADELRANYPGVDERIAEVRVDA